MSYEYDVFISYRRWGQWPEWVEKWFLPTFEHWLGEELAVDLNIEKRSLSISLDMDIETGKSWPPELARRLSRSKVMVCLWSKTYFTSDWCRAEMGHMLQREKEYGLGTLANPGRLIVGATIHDGEEFPLEAQNVNTLELNPCANIYIAKGSPKAEQLSDLIEGWVKDVANAIRRAPEFNNEWEADGASVIDELFQKGQQTRQNKLPSLG